LLPWSKTKGEYSKMVIFVLGGLGYFLLLRRIRKGNEEYHSNNEDHPRPLGTESNIHYSKSGSDFESGGKVNKY